MCVYANEDCNYLKKKKNHGKQRILIKKNKQWSKSLVAPVQHQSSAIVQHWTKQHCCTTIVHHSTRAAHQCQCSHMAQILEERLHDSGRHSSPITPTTYSRLHSQQLSCCCCYFQGPSKYLQVVYHRLLRSCALGSDKADINHRRGKWMPARPTVISGSDNSHTHRISS